MLRKIMFCLLLSFVTVGVWANAETDGEYVDKPIEWSYAAFGVVMENMRSFCETTNRDQFVDFGNWLREKKAVASIREVATKCSDIPQFAQLVRSKEHECAFPNAPCSSYENCDESGENCSEALNCGEKNYLSALGLNDILGCNIFMGFLISEHNKVADKLKGQREPGTYVEKYADGVYRIVDVILADDYYGGVKNNSDNISAAHDIEINLTSNTDQNNTKIYVKNESGQWETLKKNGVDLHTWTNDMFFNMDGGEGVRGVYHNSFMCVNADITDDIREMFNADRGSNFYTIRSGARLLPYDKAKDFATGVEAAQATAVAAVAAPNPLVEAAGIVVGGLATVVHDVGDSDTWGDYDTKESLVSFCNYGSGDERHSNGVVFDGMVANLDWMGHFLYGMIRSEISLVSPERANSLRATLQNATNEFDLEDETLMHQNAADLGHRYQQEISNRQNTKFKSKQFDKPKDALKAVMADILATYNLSGSEKSSLKCHNNCNSHGQDVVWCQYTKHGTGRVVWQEYVVDDTANGVFVLCSEESMTYSESGL